jgi:RNA polymerase sigma factor (sigma-70 family)
MDPHDHLSRISTIWTMVIRAHGNDPQAVRIAQGGLIERYSGAVHRYLVKVLGDADAADEAFQELAVKLLRGGFRGADPQKGRFRDYLKSAVRNLAREYRRKCARHPKADLPERDITDAREPADHDLDASFLESCREEFLARAWSALLDEQQRSGKPYYTVLAVRAANPELTSEQLAERLRQQGFASGSTSAAATRKLLERARRRFAQHLLDDVAATVDADTERQAIEEELIDLGLLSYCRSALDARFAQS